MYTHWNLAYAQKTIYQLLVFAMGQAPGRAPDRRRPAGDLDMQAISHLWIEPA